MNNMKNKKKLQADSIIKKTKTVLSSALYYRNKNHWSFGTPEMPWTNYAITKGFGFIIGGLIAVVDNKILAVDSS